MELPKSDAPKEEMDYRFIKARDQRVMFNHIVGLDYMFEVRTRPPPQPKEIVSLGEFEFKMLKIKYLMTDLRVVRDQDAD